ncbi:MAG: hypothetical protein QM296_06610 [Bacillota bacterium]|nr:hypothetical protein [Bacillota bacterium]
MNIFYGDVHNHCAISYGFGNLDRALEIARSHLDFVAVTGHALWPDMYESNPDTAFIVGFHREGFRKLRAHWSEINAKIEAANRGSLVTLFSYEMHSRAYGDYHFISPNPAMPLLEAASPGDVVAALRAAGVEAIAIPHHIGYVSDYRGINWSQFDARLSPFVEVYSKHGCSMHETSPWPYYHDMGPRVSQNLAAAGLAAGHRFSFAASSDHHAGYPGSYGDGLLALYADELSRPAIWQALAQGHGYALTGDRIRAHFTVSQGAEAPAPDADFRGTVLPGSTVRASGAPLHIRYAVEGLYPLDRILVYRNGAVLNSYDAWAVAPPAEPEETCLLRLELGWGDDRRHLYRWEGEMELRHAKFERVTPCFRGLSVVSPTSVPEGMSHNNANEITNRIEELQENYVRFTCETVANNSTLHPQTVALVLKISGDPGRAVLRLQLNGREENFALSELLNGARADHVKPWHSQAWRLHQAFPLSLCSGARTITVPEGARPGDYYHLEVSQRNGSMAFVSPIFFDAE